RAPDGARRAVPEMPPARSESPRQDVVASGAMAGGDEGALDLLAGSRAAHRGDDEAASRGAERGRAEHGLPLDGAADLARVDVHVGIDGNSFGREEARAPARHATRAPEDDARMPRIVPGQPAGEVASLHAVKGLGGITGIAAREPAGAVAPDQERVRQLLHAH